MLLQRLCHLKVIKCQLKWTFWRWRCCRYECARVAHVWPPHVKTADQCSWFWWYQDLGLESGWLVFRPLKADSFTAWCVSGPSSAAKRPS